MYTQVGRVFYSTHVDNLGQTNYGIYCLVGFVTHPVSGQCAQLRDIGGVGDDGKYHAASYSTIVTLI